MRLGGDLVPEPIPEGRAGRRQGGALVPGEVVGEGVLHRDVEQPHEAAASEVVGGEAAARQGDAFARGGSLEQSPRSATERTSTARSGMRRRKAPMRGTSQRVASEG